MANAEGILNPLFCTVLRKRRLSSREAGCCWSWGLGATATLHTPLRLHAWPCLSSLQPSAGLPPSAWLLAALLSPRVAIWPPVGWTKRLSALMDE